MEPASAKVIELKQLAEERLAWARNLITSGPVGNPMALGYLLEAQFYMSELNRQQGELDRQENERERKHVRWVERRDFVLEMVVIVLIGVEIVVGMYEGNAQAKTLQAVQASAKQTANMMTAIFANLSSR
jgi:hypothetical protein